MSVSTLANGDATTNAAHSSASPAHPIVTYGTAKVDGLDIFYREAGPTDAPTMLLLHGFPSSSHMFRDLIPMLAARYHVIAPDLPGFGYSSAPQTTEYTYTFERLASVIDEFTYFMGVRSYVLYMQDYGGPVGMRLALKNPQKVLGVVVQNAVVNVEGWYPQIVEKFAPYWQDRNHETEKPIRDFLTAETTRFQYTHGASRPERVSPDAWMHDQSLLDRPGNAEIQAELLFQYADNVNQYPKWQDYLKSRKPPTLVVWGNNDPFFTVKGRDLFGELNSATEIHGFDAGHFALETHGPEIGEIILGFLDRLPRGETFP